MIVSSIVRPVTLVLLWHMHQPEYRDYASGQFRQPWVYLRATKDYADMAWHLEHQVGMKAVVNFTPVLLDQLDDYADQFVSGGLRDPLLRLLVRPEGDPLSDADRTLIVEQCMRSDDERKAQSFAAWKQLRDVFAVADARGSNSWQEVPDEHFLDLLTWYHLGWTGETLRRASPMVARLMGAGARFSLADRMELFHLIGATVRGIVPRYAELALAGRIELSTTPHHHPLAPLLMSFTSAREADPVIALPQSPGYPGGYRRVSAQLQSALESHRQRFGRVPGGVWPAEGAISTEFVQLLAEQGCTWTASGSHVLANSLRRPSAPETLYRPYRLESANEGPTLFFRDDRLSDLIGFEYANWNSHDAAADLVARLEAIGAASEGKAPLVSIVLDGENCWDAYPYNGYYFLSELYELLASHPGIETTTYQRYLAERRASPASLEQLVAGSWVQGSFSTWVGSAEKNLAWDLLCMAKRSFDLVIASQRLSQATVRAASRQLAACEASDWFWWPGSSNARHKVEGIDRVYRGNLANLYNLLELPVPDPLGKAISEGGGHSEGGGTTYPAEVSP